MDCLPDRGRVVLGVCGGIAAYKAAELARLCVKAGYDVVPVMTDWATRFLGPLTLESITGHAIRVTVDQGEHAGGFDHIQLLRSAELLVVAPLTANTLAKLAHGHADNFLTAAYLAHRGKTLLCPAMNVGMLEHPATKRNLALVEQDGARVCLAGPGLLACGDEGGGRLAEPEWILDTMTAMTAAKLHQLKGRRVLVSAGPTCEDIDPVRFLTNRSSGRMGYALARAFRDAGSIVTLVHGPTALDDPADVTCIGVRSAAEMARAVLELAPEMAVIVMNSAVADLTPETSSHKLKKAQFDGTIALSPTTDILAVLGENRREGQLLIGFAAESENLIEHAREKLLRKAVDVIFANDISHGEIGFGAEANDLTMLSEDGAILPLGQGSKPELAREIVAQVHQRLVDHASAST